MVLGKTDLVSTIYRPRQTERGRKPSYVLVMLRFSGAALYSCMPKVSYSTRYERHCKQIYAEQPADLEFSNQRKLSYRLGVEY